MSWIALDWFTRIIFWIVIFCNLYWIVRNARESIGLRRARAAHDHITTVHKLAVKQLTHINEIHRRLCQLERKWFEAAAIGKREVSEFYHEEICKVSDELDEELNKAEDHKHDA